MLEGIASFSLPVLLPLAAGMGACLVTLPKGVKALYNHHYSAASHAVFGIVLASTATIFPPETLASPGALLGAIACIVGGAIASYAAVKICERLEPAENAATQQSPEHNKQ